MVVAIAAELISSSRIESALATVGCPVELLPPEPAVAAEGVLLRRPVVVVLDLAVTAAVRDAAFAAARSVGAVVIAFGSHVDTASLNLARGAGAAEVLTRGAVQHALPPLVAKHLARSHQGTVGGAPLPPT